MIWKKEYIDQPNFYKIGRIRQKDRFKRRQAKEDYKVLKIRQNIKFPDSLWMYICNRSLRFFFKNFKGQANPEFKHINLQKDYYKILEVQNDASNLTIRKSYMKLAKKLHPDLNPTGHFQFTQVQEAYNVLCHGELRKYYDANNIFYSPPTSTPKPNTCEDNLNDRDRHFYEQMRRKGFEDFQFKGYEDQQTEGENKKQQKEERKETEQQKARRKLQEQIEITGRMFRHNPVWKQANSYMNYELRVERQLQKQRQFEELFMLNNNVLTKLKKWMSKL